MYSFVLELLLTYIYSAQEIMLPVKVEASIEENIVEENTSVGLVQWAHCVFPVFIAILS